MQSPSASEYCGVCVRAYIRKEDQLGGSSSALTGQINKTTRQALLELALSCDRCALLHESGGSGSLLLEYILEQTVALGARDLSAALLLKL